MIVIGETIIGLGLALVNIPTINLLVLSIERSEMGTATAMNSVFRFLGSALGAPVAGVLITESTSLAGFQSSFYLPIITLIMIGVIATYTDEILGKNKKIQKLEEQVSV
jgi:MFS family permease